MWLAVHAAFLGVGWIPLVFAFWFDWFGWYFGPAEFVVLAWLQGGVSLICAMFAVPLLWPALIAVAWFEAGLAERIAGGDQRASTVAARVVTALGLVAMVVAVAAAGIAAVAPTDIWGGHHHLAQGAWTGPAVVAAAHFAFARALRGASQATSAGPKLTGAQPGL